MSGQTRRTAYMWLVVALGAVLSVEAAAGLARARPGLEYFILLALAVALGPCLIVRIPRLTSQVTVSDTFIFLALLLYGASAAVFLATVEALVSSLRFSRKLSTVLFNAGAMACSTSLAAVVLHLFAPRPGELARGDYSSRFILALCLMAMAQYVANSGLVAVAAAFQLGRPVWETWRKHYLWTSVTYFAGASAAGVAAHLVNSVGFYAMLVTAPVIAIIFLTYKTYRQNLDASAAQAEQAERHAAELAEYIEQRRRAEEERDRLLVREREARASAEAANRMKDEFLAVVSHELRTPLTPILGWTRMLLRDGVSDEHTRRGLESVERAAVSQEQIVADLLDVSRIITGKFRLEIRPVELAPIIEAAVQIVRPAAAAKGLRLRFMSEGDPRLVPGDPGRLQQIMWNLLSNAIKFTPEGGSVQVRLRHTPAESSIAVRDTGEGIGAEFLPYVFERFRQADVAGEKGRGGLGLGLAIVRHLVELHGGTVSAESEGHGKGATFTVRLPVKAAHAGGGESQAPGAAGQGERPVPSGTRMLVVDDAETRALFEAVLGRRGAAVGAETDATAAPTAAKGG